MDRGQYRKAFDQIPFSDDFQARTLMLLQEKGQSDMKVKHIYKPFAAAVAAALLVLTVSAAGLLSQLLSPAQVAEVFDAPLLAEAFRSDGAVIVNETAESGGLAITLAGLVSGEGLTGQDVDASHTYAVVAVQRVDGTPLLTPAPYGMEAPEGYAYLNGSITVTPLVSGYDPSEVNAATLDSTVTWFEQDGILYYLLDTHNIEVFAGHTVYLAVYESYSSFQPKFHFSANEDGSFSFNDSYHFDAHVMFTLPLDEGKADPDAVQAFLDQLDFENGHFSIDGSELDATHYSYENWDYYQMSTEEFETYCTDRLARLAALVEKGGLSQAEYDEYERILALNAAAVKDGYLCIIAQSNGEGGLITTWIAKELTGDESEFQGVEAGYPTEDGLYKGEGSLWWQDFEELANPSAPQ